MLLVLAVRRPVARLFGAGPAYALVAAAGAAPGAAAAAGARARHAARSAASTSDRLGGGRRPRRCRRTADPGSGCPCCSRSGPAARPPSSLWQLLAYRRFLTAARACARASLGAHRGLPPDRERGGARGRSRSACSTGGSSSRPISRRRYTPGERRLALDHEAVHHRRGDIWWNHRRPAHPRRSTGSIRSPGSPSAPSAPTRSWPATPPSPPPPPPTRATIMPAP